MNPEARDVFLAIARCPLVTAALVDSSEPCADVVAWYGTAPDGRRYFPEPWVGHLSEAPILFVASNPGAGDRGSAPGPDEVITTASPDEEILISQDGAFEDGQRPGIIDGTVLVDKNGENDFSVRYWVWTKRVAQELLGDARVRPGADYAMTEVVHCGSQHQDGTWKAAATCASRYLDRVLRVSPARVLVVVGDVSRWAFKDCLGVEVKIGERVVTDIGGRRRHLIALPHPNPRGRVWGVEPYLGAKGLMELRGWLRGDCEPVPK